MARRHPCAILAARPDAHPGRVDGLPVDEVEVRTVRIDVRTHPADDLMQLLAQMLATDPRRTIILRELARRSHPRP